MRQVIAFINPDTFYTLLEDSAIRVGFTEMHNGVNDHLNGDTHVYYVKANSAYQGKFDETEADNSIYILIPDTLIFDYTPQHEFAVLYHSKTDYKKQVERFTVLPNFWGKEQFVEAPHTVYNTIASHIKEVTKGNGEIEIDSVWGILTSKFILGIKNVFIRKINNGDDLNELSLPAVLISCSSEYTELKEKVNGRFDANNAIHKNALLTFRDHLENT